jgi:hypothetical protein
MTQTWSDLSFLHFSCPPEVVQSALPDGLTVDTFPDESGEEKAWVGLVPFQMRDVKWRRWPSLPRYRNFLETNVRTYVHRDGKDPGVWFFSLDANRWGVCYAARVTYALPYWPSTMSFCREGNRREYTGRRWAHRKDRRRPEYRVEAEVGEPETLAEPGSLAFFLAERYLLYSVRRGRLYTGRVWHEPYRLRPLSVSLVKEDLTAAALRAYAGNRSYHHFIYSDKVSIQAFPIIPA